jgi:hypothetical protein
MVVWIPAFLEEWSETAEEGLVMFAAAATLFHTVYGYDNWIEFINGDVLALSLTPRGLEGERWINNIPGIKTAQIRNNEHMVKLTIPDKTGNKARPKESYRYCIPYTLTSIEAVSTFSYLLGRMASLVKQVDQEVLWRIQEIKESPGIRGGKYYRFRTKKLKVVAVPSVYITQFTDYRPEYKKEVTQDDK